MPKSCELNREASYRKPLLVITLLFVIIAAPQAVFAGEGGTTHVMPGAMATIADNTPTAPGSFLKPMYLHYEGNISAKIPTAAGAASNLDANVDTFALAIGHTFQTTVLGGAHYTVVAALPYTLLDISANVHTPFGTVRRDSKVDGFGDLTLIPFMLAWKTGNWQFNALLPIYAPTGSYQKGRLGNPGLNYWTFDPMVGVVYSNAQKGFNALLHAGYAMNTENNDTDYKSGSLLHFDGAVQQILPAGPGFLTLGAEGFYFQQVTCDSGSGATLGCLKGRTAGLGPILGYILPVGKQSLVFELKWLAELDTKKRLEGDYIWFKMVYKL